MLVTSSRQYRQNYVIETDQMRGATQDSLLTNGRRYGKKWSCRQQQRYIWYRQSGYKKEIL